MSGSLLTLDPLWDVTEIIYPFHRGETFAFAVCYTMPGIGISEQATTIAPVDPIPGATDITMTEDAVPALAPG